MIRAFPNVIRGKPTLALTTQELDEAIADSEESYVFGSGTNRDKNLSTDLQALRDLRQELEVEVIRSRLLIERHRWEFSGGAIRWNPQWGHNVDRTHGYLCVLPTNEVIPSTGGTGVRNYTPIIFKEPVTGYLVEFRHSNNWEYIRQWLVQEPLSGFKQMVCDDEDIPYGQFTDPPDLGLD